MKNTNTKAFALVLTASVGLMACNPLNKMSKKAEEVSYSVTPSPLELHNDSIEINVSGSIPPRFFNKKVSVNFVPNFKYDGKETQFKTITLVGEDSEVEGMKINFEKGGNFAYTDKVAYVDGMGVSELYMVATGSYKGKEKAFDPVKVADGTILTPMLVQNEDMPAIGPDKFKKVVPQEFKATINYLVNSSNVSSSELADADIKDMAKFIKNGKEKGFVFKSTSVVAWASPEGEISLNENLADQRAASGANAASGMFSRNKVKAANDKAFYTKTGKGEDWDGFKSAMQASDIKDKNLILRVLEMYEDKTKREEEIKNLAETFEVVKENILPQLRRSEITINAELKSKSDEMIKKYADSKPDTLTAEELLYAATLTTDMDKKLAIYKSAERVYPNDFRGFNNAGYIYAMQNNLEKAKGEFQKAAKLAPSAPSVNNNLGMVARLEGDNKKAMEYYNNASGAGDAVNTNKGLINIKQGNYAEAVSNYGSAKTFNAALAQTLNKDYQTALKTVDASDASSKAMGLYLKAVVGARMKDKSMMVNNLKLAIAKDPSLKAYAKNDAEFLSYRDDAEFKAAVN
jgi:Flp pilus assembly protein TadD